MWIILIITYIIFVMAARYYMMNNDKYFLDFGALLICILPPLNIMFVIMELLAHCGIENILRKLIKLFFQRRK